MSGRVAATAADSANKSYEERVERALVTQKKEAS